MAREVTWGTPDRTHRLPPRRPRGRTFLLVALGTLVLGVLLLVHFAGRPQVASPGPVASVHAQNEARCEECHAVPGGQPDLRCSRCHDASDGPRHTVAFHAGEAAARRAPGPSCGSCHVDHRGRGASLTALDSVTCASCHFRSAAAHPELRLVREKRSQEPGLTFSHAVHVREVGSTRGTTAAEETCATCHARAGDDFEPIGFDRHCASCHAKEGSLGTVDPVPPGDVETPKTVTEFQTSGGRITKTVVHHRDEWVLQSIARVLSQLQPREVLAERGRLAARVARLRRRLLRLAPPARLDTQALRTRQAEVSTELALLEARLGSSSTATTAPWLEAALEAAATAPATAEEAKSLKQDAQAVASATALDSSDFEARRRDLLAALSAIGDADPAQEAGLEDLRRRLMALRPGDTSPDVLARARDQRRDEESRLHDEIRLREDGLAPASAPPSSEERLLRATLARVWTRLEALPVPASTPGDVDRDSKAETLEALTAPCLVCHDLQGAGFVEPAPARPVLVRARFPHGPHVAQASCAKCHPGQEQSKSSSDLALRGIDLCRECHKPGRVSDACLTCHPYHPRPEQP